MRPVASALVALLLAVAGCAGSPGGPATTTDAPTTGTTTTITSTTATTSTSTATSTPAGPANLSEERAKELALEREKAYLSARLRNDSYVDAWGFGGVAIKEARVVNRTANGYVVEVQYPYWYDHETTDGTTTRTLHADGISEATYAVRVAADGSVDVRRRSGTEVV